MHMMLESWAIRYLQWRGVTVLPRTFVGMAIGYSQAVLTGATEDTNIYRVEVPSFAKPIILNNSLLVKPQ